MIERTHLLESALQIDNIKVIMKLYLDKSPEDLRKLVNMIRSETGFLVILAGLDGKKLSLVVGRSQDIQMDSRKILNLQLKKYNGRGGGDHQLAQGGCNLTDDQGGNFFSDTIEIIQGNFQIENTK